MSRVDGTTIRRFAPVVLRMFALTALASFAVLAFTQDASAQRDRRWLDHAEEIEQFMRDAEVVHTDDLEVGVTDPKRCELEPGGPVRSITFKPIRPGIHAGFYDAFTSELAAYELGPYPENEALYRELSPIFYLAQATTPALILHGEGQDVPWRPGQQDPEMASLDFARELDKHYKIFRYKSYPGESYYVYGRSNTKEKLQDMLAFFDQYLKDGVRDAKPSTTNDE